MTDQRTKPHVVLTGGRNPSFPIKAVWFRNGEHVAPHDKLTWWQSGRRLGWEIIAVERADKEGV